MHPIQEAQTEIEAAFAESAGPTTGELLAPHRHALLVDTRRARTVLHRVNLVAWIAAAVMPLGILADLVLLPWLLAEGVVIARGLASLAFLALALATRRATGVGAARAALAALFLVPIAFYLYANWALADVTSLSIVTALAGGYTLLPIVITVGIALFPVTLLEGLILFAAVFAVTVIAAIARGTGIDWAQMFSAVWLLIICGGAALAAAVSQLHLLLQLLGTTARDRLTGAFTRAVGEELLDLAFAKAHRESKPLTVVLVDLDNFKSINDQFGHEAGDRSLAAAANVLAGAMRRGDMVVRWGGDEFLAVLPSTDGAGAGQIVERICAAGFGARLGGGRQTASLGIAEREADGAQDWPELVRRADDRALKAKQAGKDRAVGCGDLPIGDRVAA